MAELKALANLGADRVPARRLRRRPRRTCSTAVTLGVRAGPAGAGRRSRSPTSPTSRRSRATCPRRSTPSPSAEDGCRRTGTPVRPAAPLRRPRRWPSPTPTCSTTPSTSSTAPSSSRPPAATTSSTPSCCSCRPRSTSPRASPDEAHVSAVDAVAAFTRQGRDSWLHVAERLRLRAEARLTPDEPGIAEGLVMNGRALAAGGWRSDALSSTLLAALLYAEHGRARRRPRAAGRRRVRRAAAGAAPTRSCSGGSRRCSPTQAGDRGRGAPGRDGRAARGRRVAGRRSGRWRRASQAAHHGAELIELGARLAIEDRRPRELLHRIEAMRTMVWRAPLVRAPDDDGDGVAARPSCARSSAAAVDPEADPGGAPRRRPPAAARRARDPRRCRAGPAGQRGEATTTEDAVAEALGHARRPRPARLRQPPPAGCGRSSRARRPHVAARPRDRRPRSTSTSRSCAFALHRLNRVQGSDASRDAAPPAARRRPRRRSPTCCCRRRVARVGPAARRRADRRAARRAVERAARRCAAAPVSVSPSLSAWSTAARPPRAAPVPGADRPAAFVAGPALQLRRRRGRRAGRASYERATVVAVGRRRPPRASSTLFGSRDLVHLACHGAFRTRQPAVLDARARRRAAHRLRPRAGGGDARGRRAVGVQRRHVGRDQRRARCSGCPARSARSARPT